MISVTSPQQILNSQLNDSSAKYHYSFAKSERFVKIKSNCAKSFYDVPLSKTRKAGIGYGRKSDFTSVPQNKNPEPTKYQIESVFQSNKVKNVGKSFGLDREKIKDKGYIDQGPLKVPGPGAYSSSSQLSQQKYSLRPKTESDWLPQFLKTKDESFLVPGPGNYESLNTFNEKGKLSVSRYRNQRVSVINSKEKRFITEPSTSPGPGVYRTILNINPDSNSLVSTVKGNGKRFIGHESRLTFIDNAQKKSGIVPGPGIYRLESDFGHYDHLQQFTSCKAK